MNIHANMKTEVIFSWLSIWLFLLDRMYCHAKLALYQTDRLSFLRAACFISRNSRKLRLFQIARAACTTSSELKGRMYRNSLLKYLFWDRTKARKYSDRFFSWMLHEDYGVNKRSALCLTNCSMKKINRYSLSFWNPIFAVVCSQEYTVSNNNATVTIVQRILSVCSHWMPLG
jgi:hypothetical protein